VVRAWSSELVKAFDKIEEATTLIDQNDIGFSFGMRAW